MSLEVHWQSRHRVLCKQLPVITIIITIIIIQDIYIAQVRKSQCN